MKKTKSILLLVLVALIACHGSTYSEQSSSVVKIAISLAGNAYQTAGEAQQDREIGDGSGFSGMIRPGVQASVFFKVNATGDMEVYIKAKANKKCAAKVTVANKEYTVKVDAGTSFAELFVCKIKVSETGYQRVDIAGVKMDPEMNLQVSHIMVNGSAVHSKPMNYVTDDFEPLWGRRGPSVHLSYTMPEEPSEWFYNELTVPEGNDVLASYFMSNGFGEGYFGIQVNSPTERRVLFSVWSPFVTDNPKDIPEEDRIVMLKKGENVRTNDFGGEGSGGQSYMIFPWKAGLTYQFLTHIEPDGHNNTTYTAYFYNPEEAKWMLVASFRRPKTDTYYTRAHSFLENFDPRQGYISRAVYFDNQWVYGADKQWRELTEATFTCDNTGKAQVRMDYQGGETGNKFYLKNCGFFNETTPYKATFSRPAKGIAPSIDFEVLEKLDK